MAKKKEVVQRKLGNPHRTLELIYQASGKLHEVAQAKTIPGPNAERGPSVSKMAMPKHAGVIFLIDALSQFKASAEVNGESVEDAIKRFKKMYSLSQSIVSILSGTAKDLGWV